MDRHPERNRRQSQNGRDETKYRRDLVCLERPDRKGQCRLLPHSGTDGYYRIRPATPGRRSDQTSSHHLPRPNQRIRDEMVEKVTPVLRRLVLVLALLVAPGTGLAHRLDEYLQATLVTIEPGEIRLQINFTPGVAVAE